MCSKAITENSSGPNSGLGDEFSNEENRLCPEGFCSLVQELQLLSPLTTSFAREDNMWFSVFLIPALYLPLLSDFAIPGNRMLGRRKLFMRQPMRVERRGNAPYPSETKELVLEETSPKA